MMTERDKMAFAIYAARVSKHPPESAVTEPINWMRVEARFALTLADTFIEEAEKNLEPGLKAPRYQNERGKGPVGG